MHQFIADFEHYWNKISDLCSSTIPTELKGSLLLYKANLDTEKLDLITATCPELKYEQVKTKLKNVLSNRIRVEKRDDGIEAFYTQKKDEHHYGEHSRHQGRDTRRISSSSHAASSHRRRSNRRFSPSPRRSKPSSSRYRSYQEHGNKQHHRSSKPRVASKVTAEKFNPKQRNGKISKCVSCGSKQHWVRDSHSKSSV